MAEYQYETEYSDGDGGIVLQWKEKGKKARLYFKIGRMVTIELQESEEEMRKLGTNSEHTAAVQRLRDLLGVTDS